MAEPTDHNESPRILYCHCAYAQVVPPAVKEEVLRQLTESGTSFEAVADLCEMSARRDSSLKRLASAGGLKIAACYPRAVKWLFSACQSPLSLDSTEVINMRVLTADEAVSALLKNPLQANLPTKAAEGSPAENEVPPTSQPA